MLSVIIPTCNRPEHLRSCLNELRPERQTYKDAYDVVVSDDSQDLITKVLIDQEFGWVTWVKGPKRGPASNRNNGARNSKGNWLVFVDDDCLPTQDWLLSYSKAILVDSALVLEGMTDVDRAKERFDEDSPINLTGGKLWSCNFAIKKSFYEEIGGFDEGFRYPAMEDMDLNLRITSRTKVKFLPQAKVIHPWRRVKPFRNYYKWVRSNRYYLRKHNIKITPAFRFTRLKILVGDLISFTKDLYTYSFRGFGYYLEKLWFNVLMIFIKA